MVVRDNPKAAKTTKTTKKKKLTEEEEEAVEVGGDAVVLSPEGEAQVPPLGHEGVAVVVVEDAKGPEEAIIVEGGEGGARGAGGVEGGMKMVGGVAGGRLGVEGEVGVVGARMQRGYSREGKLRIRLLLEIITVGMLLERRSRRACSEALCFIFVY